MHLLFDRARLLERIDSDQSLLLELLDLYLVVQPARMAALQAAVTGARLEEVRADAHRLAGAFDSLSMRRAGALSHALEDAAAAVDLMGCRALMAELTEVFAQTTAEVAAARASLPATHPTGGHAAGDAKASHLR